MDIVRPKEGERCSGFYNLVTGKKWPLMSAEKQRKEQGNARVLWGGEAFAAISVPLSGC